MITETYDYKSIEFRWQKRWEESNSFHTLESDEGHGNKFYCLVMFPYPSGRIHMGHARNYCIGDVVARYKKMHGFRVLHPLGWDAFGLPAENAAIEHKIHPNTWTHKNIQEMKKDIKSLGISYDWDREIATCDPEYYRWNQWFFIQMFNRGLAYRKKSSVNWCSKCLTVLANEQVHEGTCWRCHTPVSIKDLDQWFFKITDYADRLLEDLKILEGKWPDEVIAMQKNWIGKSVGAEVHFEIANPILKSKSSLQNITVFTTRPDTLFGCAFLVLSPEHPLTRHLECSKNVQEYCEKAQRKTKEERMTLEKTGVFTGEYALNPMNGEKVPIWVADYVLADYGTGAIMSVPAHDTRDNEFAKKYELKIVQVIQPSSEWKGEGVYEEEGNLIHSGEFSGSHSETAKWAIAEWLSKNGKGKKCTQYRLRDWLISRQRYWGTPIPMIHCPNCGLVPVPEKDLPISLPENIQLTGIGTQSSGHGGGSPLTQVLEFVNVTCPRCQKKAMRETDTMDTFVDSSWYYLRYCDPKNDKAPFDSKKVNAWMGVDQYIGGIEHACMHLVYSRFFYKVICDLGLAQGKEPFNNLLTQGMVTLGGSAMSKSKGNIVAVQDMVNRYGADTARLFILFASPPKNQLEWSEDGVQGAWRFLNRIWRLGGQFKERLAATNPHPDPLPKGEGIKILQRRTHQTIKKVTEDIEREFQFNTAIASLMELFNALSDYSHLGDSVSTQAYKILLTLLFPIAPHLTSEIWKELSLGPNELSAEPYPSYDPNLIIEETAEIVIQVNGKVRKIISLPSEEARDEEKVLLAAKPVLGELQVVKYKFVPGRIINFVTIEKKSEVKNET